MKKSLICALVCALLLSAASPALANQWGLKGGVLQIVMDDDRFDQYVQLNAETGDYFTADGLQADHAVMSSRYHNVLLSAMKESGGDWYLHEVAHTAVYQPGEQELPPSMTTIGGGFTLGYPGEAYDFVWVEDVGRYVLARASYGTRVGMMNVFTFSLEEDAAGASFWQSGYADTFVPIGDAMWNVQGVIPLEEFNIHQMPRNIAQVRRMNHVMAALEGGPQFIVENVWGEEGKGEKLPVYAAPDEDAYRASGGKAAVSTGGMIYAYGAVGDWTLISYEVSFRTHRVGYVHRDDLLPEWPMNFLSVPLVVAEDTILTDDPHVSQYAQAELKAGTEVTGLCQYNAFYAYVKVSDALWGFVPMKDLQPKYDDSRREAGLYADVRWDVIDAFIGKWTASEPVEWGRLILMDGGEFRNHLPGDGNFFQTMGSFRVYEGADGALTMAFLTEDNVETRCNLVLNSDGTITLTRDGSETTLHRTEYSTYSNG